MSDDLWHRPLTQVREGELRGDTGQTPGMTRREAISGKNTGAEKLWMGQTHVAAGARSADHHHGDTETAIFVVSGTPAFVFADGDREVRLETKPGDYIFVPPYVPHREENPGGEEAVVIIARSSQEAIVVNLESLWPGTPPGPAERGLDMLISRGRLLLGPAGRPWALALLAGCAVVAGVLGVLFAGQTLADGFDSVVDSPFITFFAGHKNLLLWLAFPGTTIPAIVISAVTAVWCVIAGRLNGAVLALAAVPAATGLDDGLLKHVVHRTYLGALTFPSGHTTSIVALTATLAVLLLAPPQRARSRMVRVMLIAVFCVAAALVATAVIALRWHYFTDTVAGAAIGVGTVCALALILDLAWSRWHRPAPAHPPSAVISAAGHPDTP